MSKYKPMIVAGYRLSSRQIMRFRLGTRLMCPSCGTISNNHIVIPDSFHTNIYFGHKHEFVVLHKCHRCGYTDDMGSGFTDSGNYESEDTDNIYERELELQKMRDEISHFEDKLNKSKKRWAELWETDEDAS